MKSHGVDFQFNTHVTDVRFSCDDAKDDDRKLATEIRLVREDGPAAVDAAEGVQPDGKTAPAVDLAREETIPPHGKRPRLHHATAACVAHSSFGSRRTSRRRFAPELDSRRTGWDLWKRIAAGRIAGVRPSREVHAATRRRPTGISATVTTLDEKILPYIESHLQAATRFSGGVVTGGIVVGEGLQLAALSWTFNRQPQFRAQPEGRGVRAGSTACSPTCPATT